MAPPPTQQTTKRRRATNNPRTKKLSSDSLFVRLDEHERQSIHAARANGIGFRAEIIGQSRGSQRGGTRRPRPPPLACARARVCCCSACSPRARRAKSRECAT